MLSSAWRTSPSFVRLQCSCTFSSFESESSFACCSLGQDLGISLCMLACAIAVLIGSLLAMCLLLSFIVVMWHSHRRALSQLLAICFVSYVFL